MRMGRERGQLPPGEGGRGETFIVVPESGFRGKNRAGERAEGQEVESIRASPPSSHDIPADHPPPISFSCQPGNS